MVEVVVVVVVVVLWELLLGLLIGLGGRGKRVLAGRVREEWRRCPEEGSIIGAELNR